MGYLMVTEETTLLGTEGGRQTWTGWIICDLEWRGEEVNYFLESVGIQWMCLRWRCGRVCVWGWSTPHDVTSWIQEWRVRVLSKSSWMQ